MKLKSNYYFEEYVCKCGYVKRLWIRKYEITDLLSGRPFTIKCH